MIIRQSRREFVRRASALSFAGAAAPFAMNLATIGAASAQSVGGYRAIVCLFLFGGNGTLPLRYCVLVVGTMSGPTFATTATFPAS